MRCFGYVLTAPDQSRLSSQEKQNKTKRSFKYSYEEDFNTIFMQKKKGNKNKNKTP